MKKTLRIAAVATVLAACAADEGRLDDESSPATWTPAATVLAASPTALPPTSSQRVDTTVSTPMTTTEETTVVTPAPDLPETAPGTDLDFSFSLSTSASPERIWAIWTDVANWPQWDILTAALIDGPFVLGATGVVTNPDGSEATFVVTDIVAATGYEITLPLPDASITIRRTLEPGSTTTFTHRVRFIGTNAETFSAMLAPGFRQALPGVMDAVRQIAES